MNAKLQTARLRLQRAQEACPHWDYESDGCGHPCCDELADAERAVIRAKSDAQDGAQ